jgi:hypothetical protein
LELDAPREDQIHHAFVSEHQPYLPSHHVPANLLGDDRDSDRLALKTYLMKLNEDAKMVDLEKVVYFYLPFQTPSLFIYFSFYEFSLREIKKGHS